MVQMKKNVVGVTFGEMRLPQIQKQHHFLMIHKNGQNEKNLAEKNRPKKKLYEKKCGRTTSG